MPQAWVISPVIVDGGARKPKVSIIKDPGRTPKETIDDLGNPITIQPTYRHSSVITDQQTDTNGDWCLSFVRGVDLSALESDPEITIIHIAGEELNTRLQDLPVNKRARVRAAVQSKRGNIADLHDSMQIWEWIVEVGKLVRPGFRDTKGTWVK